MAIQVLKSPMIGLAVLLATACAHHGNIDSDDPSRDLEETFGDITQEVPNSPFLTEGQTVTSEFVQKTKRDQSSGVYYYYSK